MNSPVPGTSGPAPQTARLGIANKQAASTGSTEMRMERCIELPSVEYHFKLWEASPTDDFALPAKKLAHCIARAAMKVLPTNIFDTVAAAHQPLLAAQLAAIAASTHVASVGRAGRVGQAMLDPLAHDLGHQRVQPKRRGDQVADAGVRTGRLGRQP